MQQPNKNASAEKENKKVQTNKQFNDNEVTEGTNASVNNQNNDEPLHSNKDNKPLNLQED